MSVVDYLSGVDAVNDKVILICSVKVDCVKSLRWHS